MLTTKIQIRFQGLITQRIFSAIRYYCVTIIIVNQTLLVSFPWHSPFPRVNLNQSFFSSSSQDNLSRTPRSKSTATTDSPRESLNSSRSSRLGIGPKNLMEVRLYLITGFYWLVFAFLCRLSRTQVIRYLRVCVCFVFVISQIFILSVFVIVLSAHFAHSLHC